MKLPAFLQGLQPILAKLPLIGKNFAVQEEISEVKEESGSETRSEEQLASDLKLMQAALVKKKRSDLRDAVKLVLTSKLAISMSITVAIVVVTMVIVAIVVSRPPAPAPLSLYTPSAENITRVKKLLLPQSSFLQPNIEFERPIKNEYHYDYLKQFELDYNTVDDNALRAKNKALEDAIYRAIP